jgi:HK97 family phage portal protein
MDWVGGEAGQPGQVVPLHPDNVTVTIVGNVRTYTVGAVAVPAENIMHLRWFTPPQAAKGISPIHQQRTTFGIALAQARHLAQFYGEGATPSSVLETDAELTPEAARVLQATWESQHRRHRKPAVLSGGLKWRPVQASAAEMELTASRIETVNEIARVFRIPPYMVGGSGPSNVYSNTEALGLQFVQYGLLPWLKRIEAAASSLMPSGVRVEFDTSAFLRADTINRFRAHQIGIASGILSPNEARQVENLEPYEGGDDFVMALPGAPMAGPGDTLPPVGIDNDPAQ